MPRSITRTLVLAWQHFVRPRTIEFTIDEAEGRELAGGHPVSEFHLHVPDSREWERLVRARAEGREVTLTSGGIKVQGVIAELYPSRRIAVVVA